MNEEEIVNLHKKTGEWLKIESVKAIRNFCLARTPATRRKARKHLEELQGRMRSEINEIGKLMNGEI